MRERLTTMNINSEINKNHVKAIQETLNNICDEIDEGVFRGIVYSSIEHELFIIFDEHKQTVRRKLWTYFAPKPI